MRKEGCIRSPRPRSPSCTTLLYHTFPSLSGVKHIFTHNWALTTSPGLLVPGDVHGSFLHLHHLMQLPQQSCPWSRVASLGNNLHLHWEMDGDVQTRSLEEPSRTITCQTPNKTCMGFALVLDTFASRDFLQDSYMSVAGLTVHTGLQLCR